jgi:prepilin-type N-terminal cleavage/methylation domain-containing protein
MEIARQAKGFSLIELIMVMVVLGVVVALVSIRMPGDGITVGAQAEQLGSDIRYTQSLSMSRGQRFQVNFTASTYQITNASGVAQAHPSTGQTAPVALGSAVLSGYNPPLTNSYLAFDSLGVPYTDPATTLAALVTLTLTSGGEAITVRVAPQTGRVRVP